MEDKERNLLLKIASSPVLNGGFDKLVLKVEDIQENLSELKYDYKVETTLQKERNTEMKDQLSEVKVDLGQIKQQISDPVSGLIVKVAHTDGHVAKIERIAGGTDLVELQDSLRAFKALKRYVWAMVLASGATFAKVIYDLFLQ